MTVRRRGARKLALDVLYEQEISGRPAGDILERYSSNPGLAFARKLVEGVDTHREEIDRILEEQATDWAVGRMPPVDLSLMRLAVFEMLHMQDVPTAVSISEAVELAKIYSSEDSASFVNGVLGRLASVIR